MILSLLELNTQAVFPQKPRRNPLAEVSARGFCKGFLQRFLQGFLQRLIRWSPLVRLARLLIPAQALRRNPPQKPSAETLRRNLRRNPPVRLLRLIKVNSSSRSCFAVKVNSMVPSGSSGSIANTRTSPPQKPSAETLRRNPPQKPPQKPPAETSAETPRRNL